MGGGQGMERKGGGYRIRRWYWEGGFGVKLRVGGSKTLWVQGITKGRKDGGTRAPLRRLLKGEIEQSKVSCSKTSEKNKKTIGKDKLKLRITGLEVFVKS